MWCNTQLDRRRSVAKDHRTAKSCGRSIKPPSRLWKVVFLSRGSGEPAVLDAVGGAWARVRRQSLHAQRAAGGGPEKARRPLARRATDPLPRAGAVRPSLRSLFRFTTGRTPFGSRGKRLPSGHLSRPLRVAAPARSSSLSGDHCRAGNLGPSRFGTKSHRLLIYSPACHLHSQPRA